MSEWDDLLAERTEAAVALLRDAIHVELAAFVGKNVEERVRARPNFASQTPKIAFAGMRKEIEDTVVKLLGNAEQPVTDLRAFLGADPKSDSDEAQALANALSPLVDATRWVLTHWFFPDDKSPDRAEDTGADLDATYRVEFSPSPNLLWAWRKVRGLDGARNQIADAAGQPLTPTIELRLYLPEALPDEKKKK